MATQISDFLQSFLINPLKNYVTNQLAYVYKYEKNVQELDNDVEKLRKEAKDVLEQAEEDGDRYGREVHEDLEGWLDQVDEILSEYGKFKKLEDRECLRCFLSFPNLKARFDSGKVAEDIKEKVGELQKKKEGIVSSSNANNESCGQCHEAKVKLISTEYITNQLANLCYHEKKVEAEEQDQVDENLRREKNIIVCDTSQQAENQDNESRCQGPSSMGDDAIASSSNTNHESCRQCHEARVKLISTEYITNQLANLCYHEKNVEEEEQDKVDENLPRGKDIIVCDTSQQAEYQGNEHLQKVRDMMGDTSQPEEGQYRRETDDGDKKWLEDVNEILFKVESFKKRKDLEWEWPFLVVHNPITRYRQGKKAEVIKLKVERLQKEIPHNRSRRRGPLSLGDVFSNVDYKELDSRTETMKLIIDALGDPSARMVGVHGSAGVGKTTLVIEAANKARKDKLFDVMIMVKVTKSPDIRTIQGQIADMMGMTLEEESEQGRAARIKKRLKKENESTLIILDDLYAQVDLNMLGIPIENGGDGKLRNLKGLRRSSTPGDHDEENNGGNSSPEEAKSSFPMSGSETTKETMTLSTGSDKSITEERHKVCKILLISEVRQVLVKQMDGKKEWIISMSNLNDKDAETLFKEMAGIDDKNSEYKKVAAKIARKCEGLPVTIVTTAKALKNQSYSVWEDTERKLEMQKLIGTPENSTKLSYRLLENEELKITFLLCARMGQDALISDLVKFCIGLGFLRGVYTIREARDRVQMLLVTLKESGLLADSYSTDRFTMQNLVRRAALSIASEEKHAFTLTEEKIDEWPAEDKLERYSAISLRRCHVIEKFPKSIKCPRLRVFEVENKGSQLEIPDNFKEMKELRVLCLTGVNLESLPSSIKFLTKLRMLCLEQCILSEGLYIIGELKNVRILSFSGSNIESLPVQLKYLSKLQVLDISNCSKLKVIPTKVISSLTSLEELYMRNTPIHWSVNEGQESRSENASISELGNLNQLTNLDIQIPSVAHLPKNLFFDKLYSYKIIIGSSNRYLLPGFKMPEKYELSRFLAIQQKDAFDIHSQKGIKMLFERVEDLMLETLNGVHDIFYALNLKGFPCLKHLSIVGNSSIQSLIKPKDRSLPEEAFTKLKSLHLYEVENMNQICSCGSLSEASFAKLKVIMIKLCHKLESAFSISMVGHLIALETLEVSECNSLKEIVPELSNANKSLEFPELRSLMLQSLSKFIEFYPTSPAPASAEGTKILFNERILVSKLEIMKMSSMQIHQIWPAESSPFENLIHLEVKDCGNLKYLLSFSMARNLMKLQRLFVSECDQMEHIILQKQDSNPKECNAKEKNCIFPKLKNIKLNRMRSLSGIWNSEVLIDSVDNLDTLTIEECHKLPNVFTRYTVGAFQSVASLMIKNCKSMKAIFDLADVKRNARYKTKLQDIHLETLPKLEHVLKWQKDQEGVLDLNNIRKIWLQDCEKLENIFPFFLAKTAENLEYIVAWDCSRLREIVAKGEEANNNETSSPVEFKFPELTTIKFLDLPNFKSFYPRDCELSCPKLKDLSIEGCDKLEPFREKYTNNRGRRILFPVVVINKLKSMQIESRHAKSSTTYDYRRDKLEEFHLSRLRSIEILYSFLHHNPNLKSLWLNDCSFGVLVPLKRPAEIESLGVVPKLKSLNLTNLVWLKEIGFERDTIFQRIESLILKNCPCLDMIAPSSVFFSHLTNLEVAGCDRLKYLMSLRTAKSLVQLNTVKVINCNSLKEIVSEQGSEAEEEEGREKEENVSKFNIIFRQLKTLELVSLKNLESFCISKSCAFEFPSLENFVVNACSKLENFSENVRGTTVLQKVYTVHEKKNRWYWKGNLQATIQYMFHNKKFFEGMVELSVSDHPELEEIWQRKEGLPRDWFFSLKTLVLVECKFETYAIPSNVLGHLDSLQELEVRACSSITFIFEMNDIKIGETPLQLKKLTLRWLEDVTHVWQQQQEDKQGIPSFKNLQQVTVSSCRKLQTLFPAAVARDLKMLEKLEVEDCDELPQIVGKEEEAADRTVVFPRLTSLMLYSLPMLTYFYSERFAVECPELDYLDVCKCDKLDTKKILEGTDELGVSDHPQLEEVWQCKEGPLKDRFYSLKTLKLKDCKFETFAVPSNVLGRLKSLQELEVCECNNITFIFEMNDIKIRETPLGLKKLTLEWLENVTHVWQQEQEDKQGILSFKNLQQVSAYRCDKLETLFPAALARDLKMLEKLEVMDCEDLLQILGKEEKARDGEKNEFVFPRLTSLVLFRLPKLTCFYSERFTVECPELDYLDVRECGELELFQSQQEPHREDQGCSTSTSIIRQPFFSNIKGISKVEKLCLTWKDASVWLGQSKDQDLQYLSELYLGLGDYEKENLTLASEIPGKAPNLEKMEIRYCRSLKEISLEGMLGHLKRLALCNLDKLHSIWALEYLPKLEQLRVSYCPCLTTLVEPSAAKMLIGLEEMYVDSCNSMKEIVGRGQDETTIEEIKFERLERISLINLSNLKCVYPGSATLQLPSLIQVNIRRCPEMKNFSQGSSHMEPASRLIHVSYDPRDETHLVFHHDLNVFVRWLPIIKQDRLVLGDDPALKGIWLGEVQIPFDWLFRNLNSLVVEGCEFLSNAILPSRLLPFLSNLKMLEVRKCDSVKTIFDVKDLQNQPKGRISLPGLQKVIVSGCKSIESLFPASFAKDNLQKLDVKNCAELEEIVAKDDETATEEAIKKVAVFPKVTSLTLWDLPKLRRVCSGMDILDWPMLQDLDVYHCQMLKIFATDFQNSPDLYPEGQDHFTTHKHSIFSARKVPLKLKRLSLSKENVMMIEQGLVPHVDLLLRNIKFLTLQGFDKDSDAFPHVFFSKVALPSIQEFAVVDSAFKEIFPLEIMPHIDYTTKSLSSQPKKLELSSLNKLNSIGFEHTWVAPLVENLQHLEVLACSCLTNLALSTVSFFHLKYLSVEDCARLKYLFTSSSAKRLVELEKMSITNCESLETLVVADDEEGGEPDEHVKFTKLSSLTLRNLPKLGSFYMGNSTLKFPSLVHVEITQCKSMKTFSQGNVEVPELRELKIDGAGCTSLTNLAPSTVSFSRLTLLNIEDCAGLKYLLKSSIARSLVVLRKVSIINCESLETVVVADDEEGDKPDEHVKFTKLSSLSLRNLPKLGSFCAGNSTLNFPSLSSVEITACKSMNAFSRGNMEVPLLFELEIYGDEWDDDDPNSAVRQQFEKARKQS